MTRFAKHLVTFAACAVVASSANAQVDRSAAERLLQQSGTLAQIAALPPQFKTNFEQGLSEQNQTPLIPAEKKRLTGIGDEAFAVAKLQNIVVGTVSQRLNAEHVIALEKWYTSELGQRFLAMEADAAKADPRAATEAGMALLKKTNEARSTLLKDLLEASRATDFVTEFSINVAAAAAHNTSVAAAVAASRAVSTSFNEIRAIVSRDRVQIAKSIAEVMIIAYANTYEQASNDDLKAYVSHLNSSAGKAWAEAVIVAFDRAIVASANELATELSAPPKPARR
jgi:hypothetical protein